MPLLEVDDLQAHFRTADGVVRAVDGVSFTVDEGETLGIVGESGSGKSVTAMSIMRLNPSPPCHYAGGRIRFRGRDLLGASERELRSIRGNEISMIFQDPTTCLNPVLTIGDQIAEAIRTHERVSRREAMRRAVRTLDEVGMPSPARRARDYPHQLSGGMRQRAMIAVALARRPKILIADEPTTALDVTIQAQILELLGQLKSAYGMSIIMITHDLGVVSQIADRVLVMYGGKAVESGTPKQLFQDPLMPYTWSLLRAVPRLDSEVAPEPIGGHPPSLADESPGCRFAPRCRFADDRCTRTEPVLDHKAEGRLAACVHTADAFRELAGALDDAEAGR
ncbi:ABC transporter ATP-binding protein [Saccharopolyspora elongata]|uniref:ABC transporter ATP-binding protein n=1 Tax=Saccharopolyspora elongata TaxID=2530387 RepID=A0A4R4YU45_9PSEU|nr:ABC transporter ATP-binding protein [Saccharopolyspora elongata]TDD48806.1 ABC transporter ATP-binding protein [Saccharopolyspora elongata]